MEVDRRESRATMDAMQFGVFTVSDVTPDPDLDLPPIPPMLDD